MRVSCAPLSGACLSQGVSTVPSPEWPAVRAMRALMALSWWEHEMAWDPPGLRLPLRQPRCRQVKEP